ncbi:MAG: ABC transporter permease [Panacagrimonas sp.]
MNGLEGAIGGVTAQGVRGWAFQRDASAPLHLALCINGTEVAQQQADEARPWTVSRLGHADGRCGFSFRLSPEQAIQDGDAISVRVAGPGVEIPGSPVVFRTAAPHGIGSRAPTAARSGARPTLVARAESGRTTPSPATPAEVAEMRAITARFARARPRSSAAIFGRSIVAFLLREIRDRFGRSQMGYVWAILQPILYMLGFTALRQLIRGGSEDIYGVSGMYFFCLGLMPFFMFMHGLNRGMGSTRSARVLFQFRQVQPIDIIVVRVLIEFLTMMLVFAILLFSFSWFGLPIDANNPLAFLAVLVTFFMFTIGCVLLAEVCLTLFPQSRQMITMAERPLVLISGTFFTIDHMSPGLREWLLWNPLLHGTDLARGTMLGRYEALGSWTYFIGCGLFVLALGLAAYRSQLKRLIDQ